MNFHRAAARLHVSQPPLSVTIKQLEQELGADLFIREKRSIRLTEAGHVFLNKARAILEQSGDAIEQARLAAQGMTGVLNISFASSAIMGYLQDAVGKYKALYPSVMINLKQSNNQKTIQQLQSGELDLGIVRLPLSLPDNLCVHAQREEPYCLALPADHPLSKRKSLYLRDVVEEHLIIFPRHVAPEHYDHILSIYQEHDIAPVIGQEAIEQDTIAALVASNMGIAIMPDCMRAMTIPGVSYVALKDVSRKTSIATITANADNVLVRNFIDVI